MSGGFLNAAALLEAVYAALLLLLFLKALRRAAGSRRKQAEAAAIRPEIREALLSYLTGSTDLARLRQFAKSYRPLLIDSLLEFSRTVSGGARERLWDLGLELGIIHDWSSDTRCREPGVRRAAFQRLALACAYEPCRRVAGELQLLGLADADPQVRLAAARGLARSEDPADARRAFELAVSSNLLGRVLLTEALRPHAVALCESVVPDILRSGDKRVLAALEIVNAWGRAVPLFEIHHWVEQGSKAIRLQALRALPLVPASAENRRAVVYAVSDPDSEIAWEAISAATALQVWEARQALARYVRWGSPVLAKAASDALASFPQQREMLI
jgi:hypothetical protein